jgi:hypothetical protein
LSRLAEATLQATRPEVISAHGQPAPKKCSA